MIAGAAAIEEIARSAACIGWSARHAQANPTNMRSSTKRRMNATSGIRLRMRWMLSTRRG